MKNTKYYAIKNGRKKGIFTSHDLCMKYTKNFKNAEFKAFDNKPDAYEYLCGYKLNKAINIIHDAKSYARENKYAY